MVLTALLAGLAIIGALFTLIMLSIANRRGELKPNFESIILGAITNFFDTLGIGSFAPTTAWLRFRKMVPDSFLPSTLNVGHALPTITQAAIFIYLLGVKVDPKLLISCIVAAVLGVLVGAPIVARVSVRLIRTVVGIALLIAAALYAMRNLDMMPGGGLATSLPEPLLIAAVIGHFVMGALMAFGIGLYAPSLIMLSLMGLDPKLAFPIMAGACAYLMPISGVPFALSKRIDLRVAIGIAIGGIPAVLVAAFIVKDMDIVVLRWIVAGVVAYTGLTLLFAAMRNKQEAPATA